MASVLIKVITDSVKTSAVDTEEIVVAGKFMILFVLDLYF